MIFLSLKINNLEKKINFLINIFAQFDFFSYVCITINIAGSQVTTMAHNHRRRNGALPSPATNKKITMKTQITHTIGTIGCQEQPTGSIVSDIIID